MQVKSVGTLTKLLVNNLPPPPPPLPLQALGGGGGITLKFCALKNNYSSTK